jgi:hypothetical protein
VKENYAASISALEDLVPGGYVLSAINTAGIPEKEYFSYHPGHWECLFYRNESSDFVWSVRPYLKAALWRVRSRR